MNRNEDTRLDHEIDTLEQQLVEAGLLPFFPPTEVPDSSWATEARRRGREARERFYPPVVEDVEVTDTAIPGPAGELRIRVQRPAEPSDVGVLYFHGGGWTIGDLDSHRGEACAIARRAGVTVVQVDYRLAPEHPFPAAVDDALAAFEWALREGESSLGVRRWAVAGGSAGGNLAAVVANRARDVGVQLAGQLLVYPATDLTESPIDAVLAGYLGASASQRYDPLASPALVPARGLCPTVIAVGELDFLLEDNLAYAASLARSGVDLTLRVFQGLPHGFFGYGGVSAACARAIDVVLEDFARLLREAMPR